MISNEKQKNWDHEIIYSQKTSEYVSKHQLLRVLENKRCSKKCYTKSSKHKCYAFEKHKKNHWENTWKSPCGAFEPVTCPPANCGDVLTFELYKGTRILLRTQFLRVMINITERQQLRNIINAFFRKILQHLDRFS